jgi:hypothetical protein
LVVENSYSIVIDCQVSSNPSIIALEWFKDKYLLSNTQKYQILANNSLLIRNVQNSDRGQYYCTCNNTLKKVASNIVQLEVIDAKQYEITTVVAYTQQNMTASLPCRTFSSSDSQIQLSENDLNWFKLNSRLPTQRTRLDLKNGSLIIQNLRLSDSGIYMCKLSHNSRLRFSSSYELSGEKFALNSNEVLVKLVVVHSKLFS